MTDGSSPTPSPSPAAQVQRWYAMCPYGWVGQLWDTADQANHEGAQHMALHYTLADTGGGPYPGPRDD